MLKACVIGMGPIGNLHAATYASDKRTELLGVCDIIPERADKGAKKHGARAYYDAQVMLDELKPDIVSVATDGWERGGDHYVPTMQALNAGCHVLCEKPISDDLNKAKDMVLTARKLDRCFGLDFNHRFTDAARAAKRWQDEGLIGSLLFCNMALWIGKNQDFPSPYYHLKALNPHSCEIMRYFMGDVEAVHAFAMRAPGIETNWSTASINMKFVNGAVGHLTSSYDIARGHPMERCEVAGVKGRLVFEDMWREATLYPAGSQEKRVYTNPVFGGYEGFDDTFFDRIRAFIGAVYDGVKPQDIDGSGWQGLQAQMVIEAAIESLKTGHVVYLKELYKDFI